MIHNYDGMFRGINDIKRICNQRLACLVFHLKLNMNFNFLHYCFKYISFLFKSVTWTRYSTVCCHTSLNNTSHETKGRKIPSAKSVKNKCRTHCCHNTCRVLLYHIHHLNAFYFLFSLPLLKQTNFFLWQTMKNKIMTQKNVIQRNKILYKIHQ